MKRKRLQLLQNMPVFGGVEEAALELLLHSSNAVQVKKGDYFFQEQDLADSMFVLEQGKVAVIRQWQNKRFKLRELGSGDCFGEMALMDCKPRSASVKALQDSHALEITMAQLNAVYDKFPEQYLLIQMNMAREVCRRLREADKRLFEQSISHRQIANKA
ncbi:Crp/Fnr family transcriptional regulator [Kaarinaea lacus]